MGPLTPAEIAPLLGTEQVRQYAAAVDRESAYEILGQRIARPAGDGREERNARRRRRSARRPRPARRAPGARR